MSNQKKHTSFRKRKKCFDTGHTFDFAVFILLFDRYRWDKVESDSDSSDANENSDILAGIDDLPPGLHLPRLYHITSFIISSLLGNGLGPEFGLYFRYFDRTKINCTIGSKYL